MATQQGMDGLGPVLINVAATSKPHLRQRGHDITTFEKEGKAFVKIPVLRLGVYDHPKGVLNFNSAFVQKVIENHQNRVSDNEVSLDWRHSDQQGALAFLDADDGGWLELEDKWLYACGPIVDDEARKIIESKRWRKASPELHMNYKSNLVYQLSTDELKEHNEMSKKTITFGDLKVELTAAEEGGFALESADTLEKVAIALNEAQSGVTERDQRISDLQAQVERLNAEIAALKAQAQPPQEEAIPPAVQAKLEEMAAQNRLLLEQAQRAEDQRVKEKVAFALNKARTYSKDGMGHSAVFLEILERGLMAKPFEFGGETIKLEASDPKSAVNYYRNLLLEMAEKLPGQQPVEPQALINDERPGEMRLEFSKEDLEESIKEFARF